jgi:hypothetical protein
VAPDFEDAVLTFKKQHPELMARAANNPTFADSWDRAVRYRVAHPGAVDPAKAAAKVRAGLKRALRKLKAEARELEAEARTAEAHEEAAIRADVAAGRERKRLDDLESAARERIEVERLALLNAIGAIRLPVSLGPVFEQGFRRSLIDEVDRRARDETDESQVSGG